jgi:hypothetical protein
MTDRELSIKDYANLHKLDPPYSDQHLKSHNFFYLNYEGYWIENINKQKNSTNNTGWYIKEEDFFKELKKINRKLKLENLTQKK